MLSKQLSFLEKIVEDPILSQIQDLAEKQNNMRRGLFKRYDTLTKEIETLKQELAEVKQCTSNWPTATILLTSA